MADEQTSEEVDLEPIIRKIVQEENAGVRSDLSDLRTKVDGLSLEGLEDKLSDLFKKNKPTTQKIDEDSLVSRIVETLKGESGSGSTETPNQGGTSVKGTRKPGPLSRFLGIS